MLPKDDALVEPDETVIVEFAKVPFPYPPPYEVDPVRNSVTLIIHDNDSTSEPPTVFVTTVDEQATEFPPNVDAFDPLVSASAAAEI